MNGCAEGGFLGLEQKPDLGSERAGGHGDDFVAADDSVAVESVVGTDGSSVDRPRAVVVIGATVTRVR